MGSNCLAKGFRRWWREGGQLSMQPSRYGFFCHFTYRAPGGIWYEYVPEHRVQQGRFRIPPLLFNGHWQLADEPPTHSFASLISVGWALWFPFLVALIAAHFAWVGFTEILFPGRLSCSLETLRPAPPSSSSSNHSSS